MSTLPPPGMYIDPEDPQRQRFWNGTAWTDHVMPLNPSGHDTVPMYLPPPNSPAPPMGPPTSAVPPPPPAYLPPPPAPQTAYPGYAPMPAYGSTGRGLPMHMRPFSQAAVWSIVLSFFCPLIGLICGIVGISATGPAGDRRGRGAAITGVALCVASMVIGALLFASSSSSSQF